MRKQKVTSGIRSCFPGSARFLPLNNAVYLLSIVALLMTAMFAISCGGDTKTGSTAAEKPAGTGDGSSGSDSSGGSGSAAAADACKVVTQADATKLFGMPAVAQEGTSVLDPKMASECLWTWDTDTDNQLLQLQIWNGAQYYSDAPNSQPLDLGEKGNIVMSDVLGVDITWLQDGKTYTLSYSTVGSAVPDPTVKVEDVKSLAKKVEGQV
ncbi:MAG: hypothetical protein Q7K29_04170 [Thermoleophilia bacterium]|nr:hypothetical protein [Thermoleophilia bacterium]